MQNKIKAAAVTAWLAVIAVATGAGIAIASPASAGAYCDAGISCGRVTVDNRSNGNISITNTWPASKVWTLTPGQSSTRYVKDADGFRIPSGCKGTTLDGTRVGTPGSWVKINDTNHLHVRVTC